MTSTEYQDACEAEIRNAESVCGKGAPQAQLVGHLAGEVVRLRRELQSARAIALEKNRELAEENRLLDLNVALNRAGK